MSIEVAIQNGNTQEGTGARGSWLTGGQGDDTLVGAAGDEGNLIDGDAGNLLKTKKPTYNASNDNNWRQSA